MRRIFLLPFVLPPFIVIVFAWLMLGGPQWNLREPFIFDGDALFYLTQTKSTIDHGWWWWNPTIGAPFGVHAPAFAQNTNVDQAIVRIIGLFTNDAILAMNLVWFTALGLSAVTAGWGLRRLGVSALSAGAAGVLFALTPFVFYRNIEHFNLVIYLVPFPATIAILLASAERADNWRFRDFVVPAIGCTLLGFNYIYFAFFGAFLIVVGALIGAARTGGIAPLKRGALFLGIVMLTTAINLIPSQLIWRVEGKPWGVGHNPNEAEKLGLKIRHLVGPTDGHWFGPFKTYLESERAAGFPRENENHPGRLGLVGTTGFLGLMAVLIVPLARPPDEERRRLQAAATLTLAALLLGTVGGFGVLFSLLVSPEIRAYNRIEPFIAYFALLGVGIWIDRWLRNRSSWMRAGLWIVLLAIGLADQGSGLAKLTQRTPGAVSDFREIKSFLHPLEEQLPDQAMIYQLPFRPYPVDTGQERMGGYFHLRSYLTTSRLRWSYPYLNRAQFIWYKGVERVADEDLPRYLAREGFAAIQVNRDGYADRGQRLEQALTAPGAGAAVLATNDRYLMLDLRQLK